MINHAGICLWYNCLAKLLLMVTWQIEPLDSSVLFSSLFLLILDSVCSYALCMHICYQLYPTLVLSNRMQPIHFLLFILTHPIPSYAPVTWPINNGKVVHFIHKKPCFTEKSGNRKNIFCTCSVNLSNKIKSPTKEFSLLTSWP